MAKQKRQVTELLDIKEVPLEYYGMEDSPILYADGVIVQSDENGFFVSFYQAERPIALTPEDRARIKKVRTKCIGKVFLPPHIFKSSIEAFIKNLEKRKSNFPELFKDETSEDEKS